MIDKYKREILNLSILVILIIGAFICGLVLQAIKNQEEINILKKQVIYLKQWQESVEKNGIGIK